MYIIKSCRVKSGSNCRVIGQYKVGRGGEILVSTENDKRIYNILVYTYITTCI